MKTTVTNKLLDIKSGPDLDGVWQYGPNAGGKQHNVLNFTGVVADAETVTIGTNVYEFDTAATSVSGTTYTAGNFPVNVNGSQANTAAVTALVAAINANDQYFNAVDLTGGVMLIYAKVPGLSGYLGRFAISSTVSDADVVQIGATVFEFDTAASHVSGTSYTAGNICVGVNAADGGATNTAAAAALATAITANHPYVYAVNAGSGNVDVFGKALVASYIRAGQTATASLTYPLAPFMYLTKTCANGTWTAKDGHYPVAETCTNGAFSLDTGKMVGGVPPVAGKVAYITRTIVAADVTYGKVYVPLDFAPTGFIVQDRVSGGVETQKSGSAYNVFDGAVAYDAASKMLTITKGTNQLFAATDVLYIIAWE